MYSINTIQRFCPKRKKSTDSCLEKKSQKPTMFDRRMQEVSRGDTSTMLDSHLLGNVIEHNMENEIIHYLTRINICSTLF